ncbi:MAG: hypothetical protein HGA45_23370 [Chloroflexales bacterium]|nr:hypothetical protein [Chloroflexales bacterium]
MWLTAVYHQVSMFSLKPADATSTGGRSLLVPTPFSIKMALLDVALRLYGQASGSVLFPLIRDLGVALSPPPQVVVNNCFVRILKPRRTKGGADNKEDDEGDEGEGGGAGPFIRSVAFREYVHYNGPLGVALEVSTRQDADLLAPLLLQVTYFGKRGCLFQVDSPAALTERLPTRQGYVPINHSLEGGYTESRGVFQMLDDCATSLSFAKVNIYSDEKLSAGKDRVPYQVALPYRLTRSSRGFSLYERIA